MSFACNEHSARTQAPMLMMPLPLEDALAFADACELTSDEELGDFADVDIHDAFLAKDAVLVDALSLGDPAADDDARSSVLFSTDAFFSSELSMQELHTIDLGQITAKSGVNSNTSRRSRAKSTSTTARTRAKQRDSQNAATRRQRASSTAVKHAAAQETAAKVVPMASDSSSNPPAKKRIRRQREELLYLREKVKVLERSLSTLRLEQGDGESSASATDSTDSTDSSSLVENEEDEEHSAQVIADFEKRYKIETPTDVMDAQASLWEGVASRQYGERERAEHENRHLKESLEKQIQLAKSLEHILQNQPTADLLAMPDDFQALKLITSGDDQSDRDAVFDQLIGEVTRAFSNFDLEVDATTLDTMKREIEEVKVESCLQKGLAVRFSVHKRIPFSQQAVSNGMWKFIGLSGPRLESYYYREHGEPSENRIARSFGSKIKTGYATLDFRWRHVLERRSEPGRDVFIWRGVVKPIKFSGAPIHGIRFYERGWMVIEQEQSLDGLVQTCLTSSCSLSPLVDQPGSYQDIAIGALSDFVIESFHANALRCREAAVGLVAQEELAASDGMVTL